MSPRASILFDELPRGAGGPGATDTISELLAASGVDAASGLYDEALSLAQAGQWIEAAETLRMLLVLDPTDANAEVLLSKVLARRGLWTEARIALEGAVSKGAVLPSGLRESVEAGLREEDKEAEETRSRVLAREAAELRALRQEAARLRAENTEVEQRLHAAERRTDRWASITFAAGGVATALVLAMVLFGGKPTETAVADVGAPPAATAAASIGPAPADAPQEIAVSAPAAAIPAPATVPAPVAAPEAPAATAPAAAAIATSAPAPAKPAATSAPAPAKPAATSAPAKPAATSAKSAAKPAATGGGVTHTVGKGETLGAIAQKHYGSASEYKRILEANKSTLKNGEKSLQPGMKLKIPRK
jgi:nucleoid-associated protein YgaU